ncbi:Oidioi.mRNA.OKI2018_I69.PAR.g9428.t1.cds [Oikopleura dioica]|uniref:Oidioi.mRNA.OKI2018_I69.PAR.g9428.t1.cds n=1 Tax=Oikopleura dioica TaxID=34765 RepID=A0ABN7RKH1_OIKDI|nr:Oidioi.mRNA.OKI2018_I69.PAR.g9428.t1.cds [Oikopleura dioica]
MARYYRTFLHVRSWIFTDIWDSNSDGHKSIKLVRQIHKSTALKITKKMPQNDKEWISQTDLAFTLVGFAGSIVISPYGFGVEDGEGLANYIYFWRVLGYLHGLDDEFNPFSGSLLSVRRTVYETAERVLIPSWEDPDPKYLPMANAITKNQEQLHSILLYAIDLAIEGNGKYGNPMSSDRLVRIRENYPVKSQSRLFWRKLLMQKLYHYNLIRIGVNYLTELGVTLAFLATRISGYLNRLKTICSTKQQSPRIS